MDSIISLSSLLSGFEVVLSLYGMLSIVGGVVLGICIGATPGLSPSMGVALLVPFSYHMPPALAFIFFVAVYQSANFGGSITAIAINAPGTPASIVTAIDGYELTKSGQAEKALGVALLSSVVGGLVGAIVLMLAALPLASLGLLFGPAEYFALTVFGLSTVVAFSSGKIFSSLLVLCVGLLLSTIGVDPMTGEERSTLGLLELYDGISFLPVMIGLFALGEVFLIFERGVREKVEAKIKVCRVFAPLSFIARSKKILFGSSLFGTAIGVVPGAGATIASFISYGQSKRFSVEPEKYGEGAVDGIVASEAANSSSVGGALVPLLALGIPGSATDAVLLGALSLHGLVAGPELFSTHPDVVYGILISLFLANLVIYLVGSLGNRFWLKIIALPQEIVTPFVFCLCLIGSYTIKNSMVDCWVCLAFGFVGWAMKKGSYSPAALVLGLVLGGLLEENFRRGLLLGGVEIFFTRPGSAVLLFLSVLLVILSVFPKIKGTPESSK